MTKNARWQNRRPRRSHAGFWHSCSCSRAFAPNTIVSSCFYRDHFLPPRATALKRERECQNPVSERQHLISPIILRLQKSYGISWVARFSVFIRYATRFCSLNCSDSRIQNNKKKTLNTYNYKKYQNIF